MQDGAVERQLGSRAGGALKQALRAAIAGTGAVPRDHAGIPELEDRLAELAPLENRHTRIPLRDYARGRMPRGMSQREFAEAVNEDVNRIRKLAMRPRRRTGRAAR